MQSAGCVLWCVRAHMRIVDTLLYPSSVCSIHIMALLFTRCARMTLLMLLLLLLLFACMHLFLARHLKDATSPHIATLCYRARGACILDITHALKWILIPGPRTESYTYSPHIKLHIMCCAQNIHTYMYFCLRFQTGVGNLIFGLWYWRASSIWNT